jgi:hypothetical protein
MQVWMPFFDPSAIHRVQAEEGGEGSGVGPADVTMSFKPTPVLTIAKGLGEFLFDGLIRLHIQA